MTRRRHSARGLTVAQTSFYDASDDVEPSKKLVPDRQTRHGAAGVGANFELRAVKEVQEIFRGIVDDEIILSVLESCNYDSEKATSLLCEVTAAKPSAGPEHRSVDQQDRSSQSKILEKYTGPCLWDFLPMECKLQVLPLPCVSAKALPHTILHSPGCRLGGRLDWTCSFMRMRARRSGRTCL